MSDCFIGDWDFDKPWMCYSRFILRSCNRDYKLGDYFFKDILIMGRDFRAMFNKWHEA